MFRTNILYITQFSLGVFYPKANKIVSDMIYRRHFLEKSDVENYKDVIIDYWVFKGDIKLKLIAELSDKMRKIDKDKYYFDMGRFYEDVITYIEYNPNEKYNEAFVQNVVGEILNTYSRTYEACFVNHDWIDEIIDNNMKELAINEEKTLNNIINEMSNPNFEHFESLNYEINAAVNVGEIAKDYLTKDEDVINKVKQIITINEFINKNKPKCLRVILNDKSEERINSNDLMYMFRKYPDNKIKSVKYGRTTII